MEIGRAQTNLISALNWIVDIWSSVGASVGWLGGVLYLVAENHGEAVTSSTVANDYPNSTPRNSR